MDSPVETQVAAHIARARGKLEAVASDIAAGRWDDAVSRAYYAMYHAARAALLREHQDPRTHRGLVLLIHRHLVSSGRLSSELGAALARVRDLREYGDYEALVQIGEDEAEAAAHDAQAFVAAIERLLAPP